MNEERKGIDVLRESIEAVAADLEQRAGGVSKQAVRRRIAPVAWSLAAAAVLIVAIAVGLGSLNRTSSAPEVEIIELKLRGRPVQAVVVEGRAAETLIVMPGPDRVTGPEPTAWIELARLSGGSR